MKENELTAMSSIQNVNDDSFNLMKQMEREDIDKMVKEHSLKLERYIRINLKNLGYVFKSQDEFYSFCKDRIRQIVFKDPYCFGSSTHQFYLDYVDNDKRGIFIGSYSDKITTSFSEHSCCSTMEIKMG